MHCGTSSSVPRHVRALHQAAVRGQAAAPPSRTMTPRSSANAGAPAERRAPAPTPTTAWGDPQFGSPSRKPRRPMPALRLDSDAPLDKLKVPMMTQRQAVSANTVYFRGGRTLQKGGVRSPPLQATPDVALPLTAEKTTSAKSKAVCRDLLQRQVRAGEYDAYQSSAIFRDAGALQKRASKKDAAPRALLDAAEAMQANVTLHPMARRFVLERIAAHLRTDC